MDLTDVIQDCVLGLALVTMKRVRFLTTSATGSFIRMLHSMKRVNNATT